MAALVKKSINITSNGEKLGWAEVATPVKMWNGKNEKFEERQATGRLSGWSVVPWQCQSKATERRSVPVIFVTHNCTGTLLLNLVSSKNPYWLVDSRFFV